MNLSSPQGYFELYKKRVKLLLQNLKNNKNGKQQITLINTSGWIEGLGGMLHTDLLT